MSRRAVFRQVLCLASFYIVQRHRSCGVGPPQLNLGGVPHIDMELLNVRAHDGSRQFAAFPQNASWRRLRKHLKALPGLTLGEFLTDSVAEGWLDFTYDGHSFTVNDQFGEYWFFVDDPATPDDVLRRVMEHCESILRARAV